MCQLGFPFEPIISMFSTLQDLKQYICTTAGDSVQYLDPSLHPLPISTLGQGNGSGPSCWAVVSTPILNMLREKKLGVQFITAIDKEEVDLVAFVFVDDTDLVTSINSDTENSAKEAATARMQTSFQYLDWRLECNRQCSQCIQEPLGTCCIEMG